MGCSCSSKPIQSRWVLTEYKLLRVPRPPARYQLLPRQVPETVGASYRRRDPVQVPVRRPRNVETTAMGAAFAAGLAVGVWKSTGSLRELNPIEVTFSPAIGVEACATNLAHWQAAVRGTLQMPSTSS